MGKDFKIGLMAGVVLGLIALVWIATRPSQSPAARMSEPASAQENLPFAAIRTPPSTPEPEPAQEPAPQAPATPSTGQDEPPREMASIFDTPAPSPESPGIAPNQPNTSRFELQEKITTTRFHIVRSGETLSGISQQYYGSATQWRKILQANQETVPDANKISPGTKLIIPD